MNGTDLMEGRVSDVSKNIIRFFHQCKIYHSSMPVMAAFILFPLCSLFAQAPTLSGIEATVLTYDEGQTATLVTNTISVSDADSPLLASATIQISGNYSSTEDRLLFADNFSITGSFNIVTGTLTLTGPASIADFASAIQSVTYQNLNNDHPSNLVRTVSVTVTDGAFNSPTVTRNIQVNRINDIPIGQTDSFVMYEDTELDCGCLLNNDVDPDGDPLIALHDQNPSNGIVNDLGGFFIYVPNPDYYGTDTFTYFANDGTQNSAPITVHVTILPVNDPPIAVNDAITTDEDTPVDIPVLSNDTDVDDVLTANMIVLLTPPANGTVSVDITDGVVVYTPALNTNGNDSFTYQIKDAAGALSNIATVTIVVNPVNDAPVANPDFATTPEEIPVSIPVLANDTDVDNTLDASSLFVVSVPTNGAVVVQPTGEILYTPVNDFTGNDSFTYYLKDADGATSPPTTVTITVTPVNDLPVANPDFITTPEDVPVAIPVLANDTDVDNALDVTSVTVVNGPANGAAVVQPSGEILYTPETDYNGNDSFTYTVKDMSGATSLPATVTITVTPVNDAPVTNPDFATTPEEIPVSIPVLANDTDVDNVVDVTSVVVVNGPANGAAVVQPSGEILYTPNHDFTGNDSFTYTVKDVDGATSLPATVSIAVTPVNDLPVANPDFITTPEDVPVSIPVLANDTDVDDALDANSVTVVNGPANGAAVVQPSGEILYTPETDFNGNDSFTYTVKDASGATSLLATVTIIVTPVNDGPVTNPDFATTPEEIPLSIPVLANDTDVDNALDVTSVEVVNGPANGAAVVQPTGEILYTPNKDFTGNDSFTYTVKDVGGATSLPAIVTINVTPVNDAPVTNPDFATTPEEIPVSIPVLANDTDVDDALVVNSVVVVSGPANGSAVVQPATGAVLYTPNKDFTGDDSFTYTVKDVVGATSLPATVTVTVTPVNDAPVANPDFATTPEETPVSIPVLANDTDVDNALVASSVTIVSVPANGSTVIQPATGAVVYTPNKDFIGNDSFTYTVKDVSGATSLPATVTITVTPVNDAPVTNPDFATTPEEIPVSIPVLANDTDVDNTLVANSVAVINDPANGSAVVQSSGEVLYTPKKDFTGNDSFTYTVKDVDGATSAATTVTVLVTPVNDPPVAVDDQATTDENIPVDINILVNDYDVDDDLVASSVVFTSNPGHGTITYQASTGVVIYSPATDFTGNDSFDYTIQDPDGLTSLPATVSVTVIDASNRPPTAVDDQIVNSSLSPVTIDVLDNDYDEDNDHDELSLVSITNPSMGTVKIVDGKVVYQPAGLISGTVTFTYTIQDPSGLTDEAVVTIENSFLPLVVSEGFSPNNDNNNETWYIQGIEYYPNNSIKIFDRWGFLVYQKQHYQNNMSPWDGRGNAAQQSGKLLEQGTYYYILEPGNEMRTMTGYVVIVR